MLNKYHISAKLKKGTLGTALLLVIFVTQAQYIDSVYSFLPAPGQYTNTSWGNDKSPASLEGGLNGTLSLGAFGGYVIFAFEQAVENHPDNPFGVDFSIFGNAAGDWSEPGIVSVMQDENENGIPDDTWYELAGSDYFFSSTIQNYQINYKNPNAASDVPWVDNQGVSGTVDANEFHQQAYYPSAEYFPTIAQDSFFLNGTRITPYLDLSNPGFLKSFERTFGYADNHPRRSAPYDIPDNPYTGELENGGGDAFDISWAIDADGNYIDLTEINFIKIHSATMVQSGTLGYLSPEILGAIDISQGEPHDFIAEIVVIKEIPKEINVTSFQLEAFAFRNGRRIHDANIIWESSQASAIISPDGLVSNYEPGDLTLTAKYQGTELVFSSVSTTIMEGLGQNTIEIEAVRIYPNPVSTYLHIEGCTNSYYTIIGTEGMTYRSGKISENIQEINCSDMSAGLYILLIQNEEHMTQHKILITK